MPERAEAFGETLTLPGLVSADNGTYTCEASNKHGHARALYVLVVYGECRLRGPGGGAQGRGVASRGPCLVLGGRGLGKGIDSRGPTVHNVLLVLRPD